MTCSACKKVIEKRIGAMKDITSVNVNLDQATAEIISVTSIDLNQINKSLEGTHYTVTN